MITTFDQKLAELLNNWQVEGWPVGNLVLVLIALLLSVILLTGCAVNSSNSGLYLSKNIDDSFAVIRVTL